MLRIVQLVEDLRTGGLERMAVDLAVAHREAGHDSRIYCLQTRGDLADEAESRGIPVTAFEKKPGLSVGVMNQLRAALKRDRAQVIHMHNPGVHHYGAIAAWFAGVKCVINTRHGVSSSSGKPFNDRWFRLVWPLTSQVVYVSAHSMKYYQQQQILPSDKSCVIVNGIRLEPFARTEAHPAALRPRLRFGTVGRLVPVKGHAILLEAFGRLREKYPDAELHIAGGGPLQSDLQERIARMDHPQAVTLAGPRTDIAHFLSELDVFVFSSLSEGLPMTILEAMAAGLPIVSTDVGGIPEVAPMGAVAWLVPPADATALTNAMTEAAQSPRLAAMGAKARRLAFAEYSVKQMQRKYEDLYRRFL